MTNGLNKRAFNDLQLANRTIQVLENENKQLRIALQNKQIMQDLLNAALNGATAGVTANNKELLATKEASQDPKVRTEILGKVGLQAAEVAFSAASAAYEIMVADRSEDERQQKAAEQKNSEDAKPSDSSAEASAPN